MTRAVAALALALLAVGCARFPDQGSSQFTKRLLFTVTVDGKIRTGREEGSLGLPYIYIVALRLSTDPDPIDDGPLPVVVPGGNGFVAGNATHYVLYNPLASPAYQIYQFRDASLNESFLTGTPINFVEPLLGERVLRFELDMAQLVARDQVDSIQSIQVNVLTMNNRDPQGSGRLWDALGDGRDAGQVNTFLEFQTRQNRTFTNANQGNIEPTGDVADPDLDISDWSVELRLP